jgi:hypothetical protein
MPVRTTVDIPEPLHQRLRQRAQNSSTSIRSLIIRAIEQVYAGTNKGEPVTGPIVHIGGKLGPRFPVDENPHDLILP